MNHLQEFCQKIVGKSPAVTTKQPRLDARQVAAAAAKRRKDTQPEPLVSNKPDDLV